MKIKRFLCAVLAMLCILTVIPVQNASAAGAFSGNFNDFMAQKAYKTYWKDLSYEYGAPNEYAFVDIDQDGGNELIILSETDMGFYNFQVYAYDPVNKQVNRLPVVDDTHEIDQFFGLLRYSSQHKALVLSEIRNNLYYGAVCYYSMNQTALAECYYVGWEMDSYFTADGSVSKSTYDGIIAEISEITYYPISSYTPIEISDLPFVDVPVGKFYYEPVKWAYENNITSGKDATHFNPSGSCTRSQVVTFLWRAAGCPEPKSTANTFPDVAQGKFYSKAVLWAVEQGITGGYKDGTFGPDKACTRDQIVTFLWRYAGKPASDAANTFPDVKAGAFYTDAVLWAVEMGITTGYKDGTFGPSKTCTRDQIVTFLYRYLNR